MLVLCCSNRKLLIYDQMTNYQQKKKVFETCCDFLCVSVYLMWAHEYSKNQYGHTDQHADDGACFATGRIWVISANYFPTFISDSQGLLTGDGEHEHLWKTTTYVTTAHSNGCLSLQQPSVRLPCHIIPNCQMHFYEWKTYFHQNKSIRGDRGRKVLLCCSSKSANSLPGRWSWRGDPSAP